MKTKVMAAAAAVAWGVAAAAQAGQLPTGGVTAQEVAAALHEKGLQAKIETDSQGDPMIASALDGTPFRVLFYTCKAGRCAAISFATAFPRAGNVGLQKINDWSRENRFGRAYLGGESYPYVEYDVDLERGGTTEAIGNAIDVWAWVVPNFKKHIRVD